MNYRNIALAEINSLAKETENYTEGDVTKTFTVGQVILSILKTKPKDVGVNEWLMNVTDKDLYSHIETAKIKEKV